MKTGTPQQIRSARPGDRKQIENLIQLETRVHRHLDWRSPLDWLDNPPYLVIERSRRVAAALACSADPPGVAWIRLFAGADDISLQESWSLLWARTHEELAGMGGFTVASIALQQWFQSLLKSSGFNTRQEVLLLGWSNRKVPASGLPEDVKIRLMTPADLDQVVEIDRAAFIPLWQNSRSSLQAAYTQAGLATVAEAAGGIIAYQISTQNPFGGHLARLAVGPDVQHRGIGTALVIETIRYFVNRGFCRMTVNTQNDNTSSLALYEKLGFRPTGEHYPVYEFQVQGLRKESDRQKCG